MVVGNQKGSNMASHHVQSPLQAPSGTNVVSIGPVGSTYTSMEQSGRSLLKAFCDDFPNTDNSFIIPPMFDSEYPEVMPEHSRGLTRKEENKFDGVIISQSGEKAEKTVYDMINEILRKKKYKKPFLALFGVHMDNDNKMNLRRYALMAELPKMKFSGIKSTGEFDCVIVVKDLGTIHIEVKRTNNTRNMATAETQLDNGTRFVTNLMDAIRGSPSNFATTRVIALPYESTKSPNCKTKLGSFVAHEDICQNFTPLWNKAVAELEQKNASNAFTSAEFMSHSSILMGWFSSEPLTHGASSLCLSDEILSLPKNVLIIDEKVQRAEITSEEQKLKLESEKQAPLSDIIRTNPLEIYNTVDGIGLLYLTPKQHDLYYNFPRAIVHGHGGTGKTILCLMKMMDLVRSGAKGKILFVAPSPSHLFCQNVLLRNKFSADICKELPPPEQENCDIIIITLDDFFNDPKVTDESHLAGYNIFMDDMQDFYAGNVCDGTNLRKVGKFIQNGFITARNENYIGWFCFDIVQSNNLEVNWDNKIWYFPYLDPSKDAPPRVILNHVLRNTSEIISVVEEGRQTVLAHAVHTNNIVKEFYHGHRITGERVQCHRLNPSLDPVNRVSFVVERLIAEIRSLTGCKYALPMSCIAILLENESVLIEYKNGIDQMLSTNFRTVSQTIEDSINFDSKSRIVLDVAKNVASFESPSVIYIRTEKEDQVYRIISRARTKLTILDVSEGQLNFNSIDLIEWHFSQTGFINVSEFMDAFKGEDLELMEKLIMHDRKFVQLRSPEGVTPLLKSAQFGSAKLIETCIKYGCNVSEKDFVYGQNAAMIAAKYGHLEALKCLMKSGISADAEDLEGKTILHHAVNSKSVECIRWIVLYFPELVRNTSMLSTLASNGNFEMLKIFRDENISLIEADSDGNTIFHHAYRYRQFECCKWIIQNYPDLAYFVNNPNSSILYKIAEDGEFEMLDVLRDIGVPIGEADSQVITILHSGKTECFDWILKNCPQQNANRRNNFLLRELAGIKKVEDRNSMLKKLCEYEAQSKKTNYSKHHVYKAATNCNAEELNILITNEMKLDRCNSKKMYVNLEQLSGGDVTIFSDNELVITNGTSTVCALDSYVDRRCKVYYEVEVFARLSFVIGCAIGWATSDFIYSQGQLRVGDCKHGYAFLPGTGEICHNKGSRQWGSNLFSSASSPAIKRHVIGVAADLDNGQLLYSLDGNWQGEMGVAFDGLDDDTVLFPALSADRGILFVNFGAKPFEYSPPDPSFKSVEEVMKGTNIFHFLARNNIVEHCKYIVDTYPDLLNRTSGRGSPLHECASTGAFESMKVLLDAGADMTLKNIFGATVLDVARSNDHHRCVEELCKRMNIDADETSTSKKGLTAVCILI